MTHPSCWHSRSAPSCSPSSRSHGRRLRHLNRPGWRGESHQGAGTDSGAASPCQTVAVQAAVATPCSRHPCRYARETASFAGKATPTDARSDVAVKRYRHSLRFASYAIHFVTHTSKSIDVAGSMESGEIRKQLAQLHKSAFGWAMVCCGRDRDLAAEVLQQAYCRILTGDASFAGKSNFSTWVFGVIRNVALEEFRHQQRRHRLLLNCPKRRSSMCDR